MLAKGLALGALLMLGAATAGALYAENWPAFRGPQGTGVSADTTLPWTWSGQENVRWHVALPERGNSTPAVWGDRVFVTQAVSSEKRRTLMCFARADGNLLWQTGVTYEPHGPTNGQNPYCAGARGGVHPKTAQALARHSTITLTMDRYSHVGLYDEAAALETLPASRSDRTAEALKATGTDGNPSDHTNGDAKTGQRPVQRAECPASLSLTAPVEGKGQGEAAEDAPAASDNSRKEGQLGTPRQRKSSRVRVKRVGGPSWIRTSDQGIMSHVRFERKPQDNKGLRTAATGLQRPFSVPRRRP